MTAEDDRVGHFPARRRQDHQRHALAGDQRTDVTASDCRPNR